MEYLPGGSLAKFVYNNEKPLDEALMLQFAEQIAQGIFHLHHQNPPVIHRDVATRNVLLTSEMHCKITDFGLSREIASSAEYGFTATTEGPIRWYVATLTFARVSISQHRMAPESLSQHKYSQKSDAWMFGALLYEIVACEIPYAGKGGHEVAIGVSNGTLHLEVPPSTPKLLRYIITQCVKFNPDERPDFGTIVKLLKNEINKKFARGSTGSVLSPRGASSENDDSKTVENDYSIGSSKSNSDDMNEVIGRELESSFVDPYGDTGRIFTSGEMVHRSPKSSNRTYTSPSPISPTSSFKRMAMLPAEDEYLYESTRVAVDGKYRVVEHLPSTEQVSLALVERKETGELFIMKKLHAASLDDANTLLQHVSYSLCFFDCFAENSLKGLAQARFDHPYIVKCEEVFIVAADHRNSNWAACVVTKYYPESLSLHLDMLFEQNRPLRFPRVVQLFHQISLAVCEIHQANLLHQFVFHFLTTFSASLTQISNLRTQSIRVVGGCVKLGDFALEANDPRAVYPPEVRRGEFGKHSDIWMLGVVLCELAARRSCSGEFSRRGILSCISSRDKYEPIRILARRMLSRKPKRRPTIEEILALPLFENISHSVDPTQGLLKELNEAECNRVLGVFDKVPTSDSSHDFLYSELFPDPEQRHQFFVHLLMPGLLVINPVPQTLLGYHIRGKLVAAIEFTTPRQNFAPSKLWWTKVPAWMKSFVKLYGMKRLSGFFKLVKPLSRVRQKFRKQFGPHYDIAQVIVDPELWGHGIGSFMINHVLALAQVDGVPVLAFSSVEHSTNWLVARFGFEIYENVEPIPGISPATTFLYRKPRPLRN
jgi:serine/threonine protein kinase/GNAT superfamily N-acetyltransferase